jgi:hypothetical protein
MLHFCLFYFSSNPYILILLPCLCVTNLVRSRNRCLRCLRIIFVHQVYTNFTFIILILESLSTQYWMHQVYTNFTFIILILESLSTQYWMHHLVPCSNYWWGHI